MQCLLSPATALLLPCCSLVSCERLEDSWDRDGTEPPPTNPLLVRKAQTLSATRGGAGWGCVHRTDGVQRNRLWCILALIYFVVPLIQNSHRQFISSTDHCFIYSTQVLHFTVVFKNCAVCSVWLSLFGHSHPDPDASASFFLAQQRPGATLEPHFLADGQFCVCQNRKHWFILGSGPELDLKLPW